MLNEVADGESTPTQKTEGYYRKKINKLLAPGIRDIIEQNQKSVELAGLEGMGLEGKDASMTVQKMYNPMAGEQNGEQLELDPENPKMDKKTTQKIGQTEGGVEGDIPGNKSKALHEQTDNENEASYNINFTQHNSGVQKVADLKKGEGLKNNMVAEEDMFEAKDLLAKKKEEGDDTPRKFGVGDVSDGESTPRRRAKGKKKKKKKKKTDSQ